MQDELEQNRNERLVFISVGIEIDGEVESSEGGCRLVCVHVCVCVCRGMHKHVCVLNVV